MNVGTNGHVRGAHKGGNGSRAGAAIEATEEQTTGMLIEAGERFVATAEVRRIAARALSYLKAGYPVHFCGPAGTGKTTLALHVAALRARPVVLMHGDDEFGSSDLVGGDYGYRKSKLVDNYIHSVVKTEESVNTLWADNRLTLACRSGDTLVYDEFTRTKPEANNALLSVLEERLLTLPMRSPRGGDGFLEVHPEFRAIFTSNPEEYAGVHRTQDALMDRLITIKVDYFDRETEVEICRVKSGMTRREAEIVTDIVRDLRVSGRTKHSPSLRACIMIAKVTMQEGAKPSFFDSAFGDICRDVLGGLAPKVVHDGEDSVGDAVMDIVRIRTAGYGGGDAEE